MRQYVVLFIIYIILYTVQFLRKNRDRGVVFPLILGATVAATFLAHLKPLLLATNVRIDPLPLATSVRIDPPPPSYQCTHCKKLAKFSPFSVWTLEKSTQKFL